MCVRIRQLDGMKMSIRLALAAILLAAPAGAAPLCHDLRGLYTPCPPGQAKAKPKPKLESQPRVAQQDVTPATTSAAAAGPVIEAKPTPAKKSRPLLITQGHKLCRDTKGLYTPCPH
jgi:hypothetical protein